ncbi:MAG: TonB family protein [Spirochaetales bacterium]|nr:TonB family protein [Spirochaetales bacterium]
MKKMPVKEQNYYIISVAAAFVLHVIVFILLQFILNINIEALPEYAGTLEVALGDEAALPVIKEDVSRAKEETTEEEENGRTRIEKRQEPVKKTIQAEEHTTPEENRITEDSETTIPEQKEHAEGSESADTKEDRTETEEKEPYDPGLEEGSLAELDRAIQESSSTTPPGTRKEDGAATGDTTGNSAGSDGSGTTITWEDNQNRKPVSTAKPVLPDWVSEQGLHLTVVISFILTPEGILTGFKVKKSSGYPEVDNAVIDALRRWKYPAVAGTKNVKGEVPYHITPR